MTATGGHLAQPPQHLEQRTFQVRFDDRRVHGTLATDGRRLAELRHTARDGPDHRPRAA
jgi:hypothetical protein